MTAFDKRELSDRNRQAKEYNAVLERKFGYRWYWYVSKAGKGIRFHPDLLVENKP